MKGLIFIVFHVYILNPNWHKFPWEFIFAIGTQNYFFTGFRGFSKILQNKIDISSVLINLISKLSTQSVLMHLRLL